MYLPLSSWLSGFVKSNISYSFLPLTPEISAIPYDSTIPVSVMAMILWLLFWKWVALSVMSCM